MSNYPTEVRLKGQQAKDIEGPTQIILHSLANGYNFDAGVGWLESPGNPLESHFAIRKDGYRVQLVPTNKRADANFTANIRAVSIETDSSVEASEPWTADQVASIIELCADLCKQYGIPARLCPAADQPGIGWHIMWGSPGAWTPVAKACPGPARIEQVKNVVVPGVAAALAPTPNLPEIDVEPADIAHYLEAIMALPGAPSTYQQAVADIVNGVVVALTDYNLPADAEKAKAIPRTVERATQVARNRINHGQNYDGTRKK